MTAIHQNSIASHHSGNRNEVGAGHGRQATDNSIGEPGSSTVNISYQAALRLRAFQEQKTSLTSQSLTGREPGITKNIDIPIANVASGRQADIPEKSSIGISHAPQAQNFSALLREKNNRFSQQIDSMLTEVQANIIKSNEPGYQHLLNLLNNHGDNIEDQRQLQEIMRKEQFFLNRRKPFMDSSDYQSYSQVISQFTNIVERQQHSF